jgi:phospholipid transport system substrate-binding protein
MKRKLSVLIATVLILAAAPAGGADTSPSQVVEKLHTALLASMKSGDGQSCAQRFEALLPVVTASFDFPFIARLAVGRYWRKLEEAQQQALITALTRMSAATYARNFDSFSGQRFETVELKQSRKDKAVVKTLLIAAREKVDLDYICRKTSDGWKIVSVAARGVNDLSMKRAEYTRFLEDHDITALIAKINAKTEKCH